MNEKKYISVLDYAEEKGVSVGTVYNWIKDNKIKYATFGKVKLIINE